MIKTQPKIVKNGVSEDLMFQTQDDIVKYTGSNFRDKNGNDVGNVKDCLDCIGVDGGLENVKIGQNSLYNNTSGINNTGVGQNSLRANTSGFANTGVGQNSLYYNTTGINNTGVGRNSLYNNTIGSDNTGVGRNSLYNNTTGIANTGVGQSSLYNNTSGFANTGVGQSSLYGLNGYNNCSGLGYNSQVTGSNQVQLGDCNTTVYCYGALQNRSDMRDKADIEDEKLGLSFIKRLKPRRFKWNYRDSYIEYDKDGKEIKHTNDGSKKRKREHSGLIAQEVKKVMDDMGVDFGGYQDHSINGGKDVLSLGYEEFISILIKSVQELSTEVDILKKKVEKLEK